MEVLQEFVNGVTWASLVKITSRIGLILVIAWVVMIIVHRLLKRFENHLVKRSEREAESAAESRKRIETIVHLLRQAVRIVIWLTVVMIVLQEFGVAIGPIIASAGIVGLAIGFGAQNLVRDVISGFFIILENQIRVGDVAVINGTGGLVERIQFRTTVLRDASGVVHVFPNGSISTISNRTRDWSAYVFDLGVAYKEDTDQVVEVIKSVIEGLQAEEKYRSLIVADPEVFGVDKLDDSAVIIKGRIKTKPGKQWEIGREFLRRIKYAFGEKSIEIPFPHTSIYFGEQSKPIDVQLLERLDSREIPID